MIPYLNRAQWPSAVVAVLLASAGPVAWSQTPAAAAPPSGHVHGLQLGTPSSVAPPAKPNQPSPTWQDANRAVGQFPRGHADVLRWEQKNTPQATESPPHSDDGQLTLAKAMRLAQQDQPQWIKPGMSAPERAEASQKAAALRWQVQQLWVDAVASRQSVAHSRDILTVAEAGAELGQRMASVGNWSRARQIQEELPLWEARARLGKAHLQAERALQALWQRVGAGLTAQALSQQLPIHLPVGLPVHFAVRSTERLSTWQKPGDRTPQPGNDEDDVVALQTQALESNLLWSSMDQQARQAMVGLSETHLKAAQQAFDEQSGQDAAVWTSRNAVWGHAFENALQARRQADRLARQVRADVKVAHSTYAAARKTASTTQADVLRLHTELSQETLLRYNGMLKSTWDLLASARTRIDSVDAALQAQRQAWLAHADLMAVLAGLPYTPSADALGASARSKNNTPGH